MPECTALNDRAIDIDTASVRESSFNSCCFELC